MKVHRRFWIGRYWNGWKCEFGTRRFFFRFWIARKQVRNLSWVTRWVGMRVCLFGHSLWANNRGCGYLRFPRWFDVDWNIDDVY